MEKTSAGTDQQIWKLCLPSKKSTRMLNSSLAIRRLVRIFLLILSSCYYSFMQDQLYYLYIIGVEVKFKHLVYPIMIQPTRIKEMREIVETQQTLKVGASVTLVELEETLKHHVKTKPGNTLELYLSYILFLYVVRKHFIFLF